MNYDLTHKPLNRKAQKGERLERRAQKGDVVLTTTGQLIGHVIMRRGDTVWLERPGRRIVSKVHDFDTWKEKHGWQLTTYSHAA